jgi:hypothetical protein
MPDVVEVIGYRVFPGRNPIYRGPTGDAWSHRLAQGPHFRVSDAALLHGNRGRPDYRQPAQQESGKGRCEAKRFPSQYSPYCALPAFRFAEDADARGLPILAEKVQLRQTRAEMGAAPRYRANWDGDCRDGKIGQPNQDIEEPRPRHMPDGSRQWGETDSIAVEALSGQVFVQIGER